MSKDDDGNIDGAENGKLMRLFEQTTFTFQKGSNTTFISKGTSKISVRVRIPRCVAGYLEKSGAADQRRDYERQLLRIQRN